VVEAYRRLASRFDFIILEGAGSISELNLKKTDLVNLGLAKRLRVPVLLTADIDRGGVFASIVGTFQLLDEAERPLVRSFAINRFRGDATLFAGGVTMLEERTGAACVGVFPYLPNVPLDAEDGMSLEGQASGQSSVDSGIGIVALPHISNLTDFRLIPDARRISRPLEKQFELVIVPGTKNTLGDLEWLHATGIAAWILEQHAGGARILGICGGYQMLGEQVEDPFGMESDRGCVAGLGLLPGRTTLAAEKITRRVHATTPSGVGFEAYEIHLGITTRDVSMAPFAVLADGTLDGCRSRRVTGTYLHGAIEDPGVLGELLGHPVKATIDRERVFEALADWFDANVNWNRFEELYLCS